MNPYFDFGQSLGPETISKEYKDFSFTHLYMPYKEYDLERFIVSGEWLFDELVEKTMTKYVHVYIPKYVASFLNPKTELDEASFYVGIDDNGIVNGIPYMGKVTHLEKIVKESIDPIILDYLKFEWIPVTYTSSLPLPEIHFRLLNYYEKKRQINEMIRMREISYEKWMVSFKKYSQKLVEIYNDPECRPLFIQYVKERSPVVYEQIINGFEMKQQPYQMIQDYCKSKDNVYYWICQWKDENLHVLRKTKPKPINRKTIQSRYGPLRIFSKVREMIPYWMKKNSDLSLYVLKISIRRDHSHSHIPIQFEYKSTTYIRSLTKSIRNGQEVMEPCCIPIYVKNDRDLKNKKRKLI